MLLSQKKFARAFGVGKHFTDFSLQPFCDGKFFFPVYAPLIIRNRNLVFLGQIGRFRERAKNRVFAKKKIANHISDHLCNICAADLQISAAHNNSNNYFNFFICFFYILLTVQPNRKNWPQILQLRFGICLFLHSCKNKHHSHIYITDSQRNYKKKNDKKMTNFFFF